MFHKDFNYPKDFTPKFIPSSFWGEADQKRAKATATILWSWCFFTYIKTLEETVFLFLKGNNNKENIS